MPTPFNPTATADILPTEIQTVDDFEPITQVSYQEGEFKPAFRAIRYLELHAMVDTEMADALGDPGDANRQTFIINGKIQLADNGEQDAAIEVGANTEITVKEDGRLVAKADSATTFEADSVLAINTNAVTLGASSIITATSGAKIAGPIQFTGTIAGITKVTELQYGSPLSVTRTGYSTPVVQSGAWAVDVTSGQWTDTGTGGLLRIPVDVPNGAILKTVRVYIDPANGTHGGVPTASIVLAKRVIATNDGSSPPAQSGGTEVSGSIAAYEACHALTLTLTGGGHTVNRATSAYHVILTGEDGGQKQPNLVYVGIEYDYDVVEIGID